MSIARTQRNLTKRFAALQQRFTELDIAGTDAEAQALIEGLITPGIGGALDAIGAIIDAVSAYTGEDTEAEDDDAVAADDGDDEDYDDDDAVVEDDEDFADDDDDDTVSDDDDDDFEDDADFADDDDDTVSDDDDFADVEDDEDVEPEPAPRRRAVKPAPAPVKPSRNAAPVKPAAKPVAKATPVKPAPAGKPSKAMQKAALMKTAELKEMLVAEQPKRAAAITAALANVGPRAKQKALFDLSVKKGWIV